MVEKYTAYPKYKDSGVEWLDDVPSNWFATKLKFETQVNMGQSPSSDDCNTDKIGIPFLQGNTEFGSRCPTAIQYSKFAKKIAQNGEMLFTVRAPVGALNIADQKYGIGRGLCALSANKNMTMNYLWWLLIVAKIELVSISTGSTFEAVSAEQVKNVRFFLPSEKEQTKIANFLDHETAKIDRLIEKQQQLIKLLKEKRQAVISHSVTKGLDPTAPMRDSGVEWLGDVPSHWEVIPLKHLCKLLKDGTHLPPPRVDSGIPLLSVRNIVNGEFKFRQDDSNISEEDYRKLSKAFSPQLGDVLLAIVGATLGKTAIVKINDKFQIQRSVAIFRVKEKIMSNRGLNNIFSSSNFQSLLWENVGFSAQPGIYLGTLENFIIPVPPINEQLEINSYCSNSITRLDKLITKVNAAIDLIKERRTALISAAVTGKIDVRDWQAPEETHSQKEDAA